MELRPYQQEAREAVERHWQEGKQKTLLVLPTGCHAKDERVLMANGAEIKVQDVKVGMKLMGDDGNTRTVLHLTHGNNKMLYKIIPVKGEPFIVTEDHKLTLVRTNERSCPLYPCQNKGGEITDVTVGEWLTWSKNKKHLYKLIRSKRIVLFHGQAPSQRKISPYFLGILLGDGGLTTGINVTTPDAEIVKEIKNQAKKYGMELRAESAGKANTYWFHGGDRTLHKQLRELGIRYCSSKDKFVPEAYKTAPMDVRLEVIAGLIDSDGHKAHGEVYDFISKSARLSNDLAFMCRSCGLAAYVTKCTKSNQYGFTGEYYRVCISGELSVIPCRVKRKISRKRLQKKDVLRTGFKVEPIGIGEYFGFTVDGNNRYLMSDFTITHNCGKTIVFAKITEDCVRNGDRVLILAHRGELLNQASEKLYKATGLMSAVEKAEETCIGSWFRVVVGSVQTLQNQSRLSRFPADYFHTIIIDEAHHALSDSYSRILEHFNLARVLGVTATPDRGDRRNLGQVFDSLAYEYTLPKAIKEGYLSPIKAVTIPLTLDLSGVAVQSGDFRASDLGTALDPYLYQIADEMKNYCKGRKTVVFLPLVSTSKKFRDILNENGFSAAEVNGESRDRETVLKDFENNRYNVLCNSMLLTEGWDCPDVDCIVVLRPTKVRGLYSQMVGRGTRLAEGKKDLLLLDFLWHTERHELCRPASLICESEEVAKKMTENLEKAAGQAFDIEEAERSAAADVVTAREESLAKVLGEMKSRRRKLVDPLQFEMSIQAEDLASYVPSFGWEMAPASEKQIKALEKYGIFPDEIENAGKASLLLDRLNKRRMEGLTTAKQIRFLESKGFLHVGTWRFEEAKRMIDRIAANGWMIPRSIIPSEYRPMEA